MSHATFHTRCGHTLKAVQNTWGTHTVHVVLEHGYAAHDEIEKVVVECLVVMHPNAIAHEWTVVVKLGNAAAAYAAVLRP